MFGGCGGAGKAYVCACDEEIVAWEVCVCGREERCGERGKVGGEREGVGGRSMWCGVKCSGVNG